MDKKLINEAIKGLNLIDIFLYSTKVERFEEIYDYDFPEDMFQQTKHSIKIEHLELESNDKNKVQKFLHAKISLGIRFVHKDEKDNTCPLSEIEACFIAKYLVKENVSDAAKKEFVKFNAIHNVWPFWREHAFRTSKEARLPTPNIPLFGGNNIN